MHGKREASQEDDPSPERLGALVSVPVPDATRSQSRWTPRPAGRTAQILPHRGALGRVCSGSECARRRASEGGGQAPGRGGAGNGGRGRRETVRGIRVASVCFVRIGLKRALVVPLFPSQSATSLYATTCTRSTSQSPRPAPPQCPRPRVRQPGVGRRQSVAHVGRVGHGQGRGYRMPLAADSGNRCRDGEVEGLKQAGEERRMGL